MKVTLILADAASTHPDGTFSLLRGGITKVNVPKNQPITFKGALVARISGDGSEAGNHDFKMICVDEDGNLVGQEFTGSFSLPPQGGHGNLVVNLQYLLPRLGRYEFLFSVDKHRLDSWPLEAREVAATQSK